MLKGPLKESQHQLDLGRIDLHITQIDLATHKEDLGRMLGSCDRGLEVGGPEQTALKAQFEHHAKTILAGDLRTISWREYMLGFMTANYERERL